MYVFSKYILLFFLYSLLGAIAETLFRFATEGQVYGINGFLYLPIFPIYGFGALAILFLIRPWAKHPVWLFIASIGIATALEFVAHWLIELLFGIRIWDYSHKPFNIEGRVSLDTSVGFGVAALLLVYALHPLMERLLKRVSKIGVMVTAGIICAALIADTVLSAITKW